MVAVLAAPDILVEHYQACHGRQQTAELLHIINIIMQMDQKMMQMVLHL